MSVTTSAPARPPLPDAPGLRLPDDVVPLGYDLTLELDPDRDTFAGEVRIRVRLDRATDHVWIHADQLHITSARYTDGPLAPLPVEGDQMRAFGFGRTVGPGELELAFSYTGRTTGDQEGLFRQRAGDHWYLFSQGEAVFARRIVPCFDEPRFKTPWRVTVVVPRTDAALANMPAVTETTDGERKRITFGDTPAMPSYLLALAVGPFDVVEVGKVGGREIPVRVAVRAGAGKQVAVVGRRLPQIVGELEAYLGEPLPVTKLDLVGVPEFFGAMENPGLVTFEEQILLGKDGRQRGGYFTHVTAHELAHQWFGNSLTPAWWDDLWLSESFASWLADKVSRKLGAFDNAPVQAALSRREALAADTGPLAIPLRRAIAANKDPDRAFDAIAYQKGQAVLATFEALVGEDAFRELVRDYVRAHVGGSVTARDFVTALARASSADVGAAFEQYVTQTGAPVVDLELRCDGKPAIVAHARDRRLVPACVRPAGATTAACALVDDVTELPLSGACPAWVEGNALGGYYHVHWQDRAALPPLDKLAPAARIVAGDDLAAAFRRGELAAADALAALGALLAADGFAQLSALALAHEIDDVVTDAARPAWSAWLAPRIASVARSRKQPVVPEVARALRALLAPADRAPAAELRKQRELALRVISADQLPDPALVAIASAKDGDELFDRIVDKARSTIDGDRRGRWLALLGEFPATFAEPTAALAAERAELPIEPIWAALEEYFERPTARVAGWRALRAHLGAFTKRMPDRITDLLAAAASLCDARSREEVAKAFAGTAAVGRTLAAIDQCIARRAARADLAAVLAAH